ncbi:MAG: hypothetical protein WBL50_04385 [Candidatus Acidiferrum sp.]
MAVLSFLARPCWAQEPDVGFLAQMDRAIFPFLQPSGDLTSQQQDGPDSQQEKQAEDPQRGTPNDRILWTMANFLTLENAGDIPPLTVRRKFKVTARGGFDAFEFVLIVLVTGINQASNSNPTYGQGMQGYAKRYGTAYGDNAIENFMASAVFPWFCTRIPATINSNSE